MLIRNGANFNMQDENGYSALHYAAAKNNLEAASIMIDYKSVKYEVKIQIKKVL